MDEPHPTLEIEGLSEPLEPLKYSEEWDEKRGLAIHAHVRVAPPLGEELRTRWRDARAAQAYFGVVRSGRDDKPREMRFGMPIWSQHDDHEKHEVILVDRINDDGKKSRWPGGPEELKETGQVLRTAEQMDTLLTLLVEKGQLAQSEVDRVREVSDERLFERLLEFRRVDDLDDWE